MSACRVPSLRGGLLVLAAALASCSAGPTRPNIVLIVADTARVDRFSCFGYERPTTPHIDALCARGIRFDDASSTSIWTVPAHASLFTGLYAIRHRATQEHNRLEAGAATLAELLGAAGYETFAVSGNVAVGRRTGLVRGFAEVVETWRDARGVEPALPAQHPNLVATERLLAGRDPSRPFFLFVNYVEPHGPYRPPEPFLSRFLRPGTDEADAERIGGVSATDYYLDPEILSSADLAVLGDLYDAEIAYTDALVGALLEKLEGGGFLDDTLVVFTSDHGEQLGEHGHIRHVFNLYGTALRVPLVIRLPGDRRAGGVRSDPVSLVDLFVTLLRQAGVTPPPSQAGGRDLLLEGPAPGRPRFAEYYYPTQALGRFTPQALAERGAALRPYRRRLRSVEAGGARLIWASDGRHELFDLRRDPAEQVNRLEQKLADFVEAAGGEATGEPAPEERPAFDQLDASEREQLRALGYLP